MLEKIVDECSSSRTGMVIWFMLSSALVVFGIIASNISRILTAICIVALLIMLYIGILSIVSYVRDEIQYKKDLEEQRRINKLSYIEKVGKKDSDMLLCEITSNITNYYSGLYELRDNLFNLTEQMYSYERRALIEPHMHYIVGEIQNMIDLIKNVPLASTVETIIASDSYKELNKFIIELTDTLRHPKIGTVKNGVVDFMV